MGSLSYLPNKIHFISPGYRSLIVMTAERAVNSPIALA